jgi:hypothetical protein
MTFRAGDRVRITYNGESVEGEILMAAPGGLSLTLTFDQYLGGYTNLMPVLWLNSRYVDLLLAEPVEIKPLCRILPWPQEDRDAQSMKQLATAPSS